MKKVKRVPQHQVLVNKSLLNAWKIFQMVTQIHRKLQQVRKKALMINKTPLNEKFSARSKTISMHHAIPSSMKKRMRAGWTLLDVHQICLVERVSLRSF